MRAVLYLEHTEHMSKEEADHAQAPLDVCSLIMVPQINTPPHSVYIPLRFCSVFPSRKHLSFSSQAWPCGQAPFYSLLCLIQVCGWFPYHGSAYLPEC